ncbi:MAG TPA: hypothetical protein VF042_00055, partial [Gemmatimonadaceae bacterium]
AVIIEMVSVMITEDASFANHMHGSRFYIATSILFPVFLIAFARASRVTWPATKVAAMYMLITMLAIWVLQLFPATPKLAPIYNQVTHMVPPAFPLLLVIPAAVMDRILMKSEGRSEWINALVLGASFVAVMLAVHWFWAEFMLSPASRNFFFGADQWDYTSRLGAWRYQYWNLDRDAAGSWSPVKFGGRMIIALVIAVISSRLGLAWGRSMSRIRR